MNLRGRVGQMMAGTWQKVWAVLAPWPKIQEWEIREEELRKAVVLALSLSHPSHRKGFAGSYPERVQWKPPVAGVREVQ